MIDMQNLFLDTNVILDVMLRREPYCLSAANLLALPLQEDVQLYATALTYSNALYVARKALGTNVATDYLRKLNTLVRIAPTTQQEVAQALATDNPDLEDAFQYFSAKAINAHVIITRNPKHFQYSEIPVMTADEFLR